MDIGFTDGKRSDWTALVIVGQDTEGYYYVLGIDRIKTVDYNDIYNLVFRNQDKFDFRKIHVESNAGGKLVAEGLKRAATSQNRFLAVHQQNRTSHEGTKVERIAQWLDPIYHNQTIYHPQTGMIDLLEEELLLSNPPHDDIKDTLATAIQYSRKPISQSYQTKVTNIKSHSKYGGVWR
jgi:phage terminase large subunit-like protein